MWRGASLGRVLALVGFGGFCELIPEAPLEGRGAPRGAQWAEACPKSEQRGGGGQSHCVAVAATTPAAASLVVRLSRPSPALPAAQPSAARTRLGPFAPPAAPVTKGASFVCKTGSAAYPSEFAPAASVASSEGSHAGPLSGLLFHFSRYCRVALGAGSAWSKDPRVPSRSQEAVGVVDQVLPAPPVTDDSAFCRHLAEPFTCEVRQPSRWAR